MTTMRIRVLGGVVLAVLLFLTSTAAYAAPPVITIREGSGTGTFSCGTFEVQEDYSFQTRITLFYDNQGNLVRRLAHLSWSGYMTNTTTGQTLWDHAQQISQKDYRSGISTYVGHIYGINVPGRGIVVKDIGRLVEDANGNIIFQAGTFQVEYGGVDVICAAFD
jgi:hypothetical protein